MKRTLFCAALALGATALLGLAAGRARADQPPAALPKGPAGDAPSVAAPPAPAPAAPAAPVVVAPAPVPAACCAAPACEAACTKKVCVGEKATREKTTRVYGDTCEDFCLPKCSLTGGFKLGHHHDDCDAGCDQGCDAGGCASCGNCVRTRKYLVVRIKKEEECYTKCHVEEQLEEPKCKTSLFHHKQACDNGACAVGTYLPPATVPTPLAPMPPAEKVSAPKDK
jgi:hypothetical protein